MEKSTNVGDQLRLYAGFEIFTGKHTQLYRAVIASTVEAANDKLPTGILGLYSIDNHAGSSVIPSTMSGSAHTKFNIISILRIYIMH